ncbi:hypothetical protein D8674_025392 [Pyrus ussuriensis x Pyrus communis]|uniref:Uncharacterized protein n=1 Tax=Pyrus ussuriensis x Pyrus communis TaxID=2448454 RepID=A0A5N5HCP3_9ROSA|nr:hypothetical protein D8674_025392 [Pyrus ussuriensis x Pyrus communis]
MPNRRRTLKGCDSDLGMRLKFMENCSQNDGREIWEGKITYVKTGKRVVCVRPGGWVVDGRGGERILR